MKKWDVDDNEEDVFGSVAPETSNVPVNEYLEDPLKAIDLLSRVVGRIHRGGERVVDEQIRPPIAELRKAWLDQLRQLEPIELPGHLDFHHRAMTCCDRIKDQTLASTIGGKIVLGVGGRFSAGKSAFINSVVGLGPLLPENGRPTTSIPTYVTKGKEKRYVLTSMNGRIRHEITASELQVLSHEFDDRYHIGFSSFIDSCVISTPDFGISPEIVLLDTPGYSKPEDVQNGFSLSDKEMALNLLRRADRLIWLVRQKDGSILDEDLRFLDAIGHDSPVLIVVTHADQKGRTSMRSIIDSIAEMSKGIRGGVFGITGYSSPDNREFNGGHLIGDFLEDVLSHGTSKNDVVGQLANLEADVEDALVSAEDSLKTRVSELKRYIANTKKVNAMHSLAMLMASSSDRLRAVQTVLKGFPSGCASRKKLVDDILRSRHA